MLQQEEARTKSLRQTLSILAQNLSQESLEELSESLSVAVKEATLAELEAAARQMALSGCPCSESKINFCTNVLRLQGQTLFEATQGHLGQLHDGLRVGPHQAQER
eukprot:TRINITY_DN511_c0_g1_i8.p1 TRINITY_DN511_c0_g1~~TRINITY_DN511_c0_g1_i8.p1  ORF type:complete len:106 (+),score=16.94 TRINITY_DN511_c0_g1_i8:3-320(+)